MKNLNKKIALSTILATSLLSSFNSYALTDEQKNNLKEGVVEMKSYIKEMCIDNKKFVKNIVYIKDEKSMKRILNEALEEYIAHVEKTFESFSEEDYNEFLKEIDKFGLEDLKDSVLYNFQQVFLSRLRTFVEDNNIISEKDFQQHFFAMLKVVDEEQMLTTEEKKKIKNNILKDLINEKAETADKMSAIQRGDANLTDAINQESLAVLSEIEHRADNVAGFASGEGFDSFGAWIKATYGTGTQKAYGKSSGYKYDQQGVTVGVDAGDEHVLGLAFSFFKNNLKDKLNSETKDTISSYTLSLYGKAMINEEVFVNGQFQYGKSNIKKKRDSGIVNNPIVEAKTKADNMAARFKLGYDYAVNSEFFVTPSVGLGHSNIDVKGYKETGEGFCRSVEKRKMSRTSALLGISSRYNLDSGSSMKIIPEIHANVDYAVNSKNGDTKIIAFDGADPIITPSEKLAKAIYNVGISAKAVSDANVEFTAGYDFGFAKKFQSHTGSLKVRVNF